MSYPEMWDGAPSKMLTITIKAVYLSRDQIYQEKMAHSPANWNEGKRRACDLEIGALWAGMDPWGDEAPDHDLLAIFIKDDAA